MPSITVVPEASQSSSGGGPVIAGLAFRRPNARGEGTVPLRQVIELGSGATRSYSRGRRMVYTYAWSTMTEEEVSALRAALSDAYVPLEREAGEAPVVVSTENGLEAEAIPGTFPVRYSVTVSLPARDPVR